MSKILTISHFLNLFQDFGLFNVYYIFYLLNFLTITWLLNVYYIPPSERRHDGSPSVQCDGQHGEHRGRHGAQGDELVEGAVEGPVVPLPVPHVDEGEDTVEGGHQHVSHGQVQQEVVGHTPHSTMG